MSYTPDLFSNFVSTLLTGGAGGVGTPLNPGDTSLSVTGGAGAGMPTPGTGIGTYRLLLGLQNSLHEIVVVQTRVSDTMTSVLRAQEGTTAQTWPVGTPITLDVTAQQLTNISSNVATLPFNVKAQPYGAKGDGVTDDSAAIAAAVADAITAGGGRVYFPPGVYIWAPATTLNVSATNGIALVGGLDGLFDIASAGAGAASGAPSVEIRYTASGAQTFINAQKAMGFAICGMAIRYSSTTYTGRLIDAGAAGSASTPSVGLVLRAALLSGTGVSANGATLLYLDGSVTTLCQAVTFGYAATAVQGRDASAGAGYATSATFVGCRWFRHATAILNPDEQWALHGCNFEINPSNNPVTIKSQDGTRPTHGLTFNGCGFWDTSGASSGFFVDVFGGGVTFVGCFVDVLGAGSGFLRINTDVNLATYDGLALHGTAFNGGGGTILTTSGTGSFSNLDIGTLSNLGALTDPTSSLDLTTNPVSFAPVRSTLAFSSYSAAGAINLRRDSVQALTLTGSPVTPTFPSVGSGVAHKLRLELVQDATGSRTVTWPASVKWGAAGAPVLSTAANAIDIVEFVSRDAGVTWRGVLIGKGF